MDKLACYQKWAKWTYFLKFWSDVWSTFCKILSWWALSEIFHIEFKDLMILKKLLHALYFLMRMRFWCHIYIYIIDKKYSALLINPAEQGRLDFWYFKDTISLRYVSLSLNTDESTSTTLTITWITKNLLLRTSFETSALRSSLKGSNITCMDFTFAELFLNCFLKIFTSNINNDKASIY